MLIYISTVFEAYIKDRKNRSKSAPKSVIMSLMKLEPTHYFIDDSPTVTSQRVPQ